MGEEQPVDAVPSAEGGAPPLDGEKKKTRAPFKRDERPVEELFDLTKPIPKVNKPDKDAHEAELEALTKEIDALKASRNALQDKIDSAMGLNKNGGEIGTAIAELSKLRAAKGKLIDEKKAIRAQLDGIKTQTDKLVKDRKDTRSSIKFSTVEEIDEEIAKLVRKHETTSMSLTDEKKMLKEMDMLKASKSLVKDLKSKETSLEDAKEQRKNISALIAAKDKEIDTIQAQIDTASKAIDALREKDTNKKDALKALFTERDEFKGKMNEIIKKKDASRNVFRDANNDWFNYQRAIRAQKQLQYLEEKKAREEAQIEWQKKMEEEEAKKIPYEEEQALCEYLSNFLTRAYMTSPDEDKKKKEDEGKKDGDIVAVKEDPFAGFKPSVKKASEGEDVYFGKGKTKKKRVRDSKDKKVTVFSLDVDIFSQFGYIQLDPPTSLEQVPASIEALKAKKVWYSEQPRGSVPTATEIRKTTMAKQQRAPETKVVNSNKFDPNDFAPLTTGGAGALNASWGQSKAPAGTAAPVEDDFVDEEVPEPELEEVPETA